jgi:hypothetical protein
VSGTVTLTDDEKSLITDTLNTIEKVSGITDWTALPNSFYIAANTFINTLIRQGKFVEVPEETFNSFKEWYSNKLQKEIEKLKTDAGRQKKTDLKNKELQYLDVNKMSIINIFNLTKKLADIKKIFFNKYSTAIKTKQFISQPDGTLKVTPGEGFVAVDRSGNMVKLVDRLEFSRANFAISKEEKFK